MSKLTPNSELRTPTTRKLEQLRVAIVCDWLTSIGGAERVVLELHKLFPEAPIYTSQYNPAAIDWFKGADVRTTWLQKLPKNNTFRKFLPILRRFAFEGLDLREYDLVISSSGAEAKAVKRLKRGAIHVTYCHSPTHYYWSRYEEYLKNPGFRWLDPLARLGLKIFARPMRRWDFKAAQRPDYFIANSSHIQKKIKEYYNRESIVIHPPVDTERFKKAAGKQTKKGFVAAGRQVPYKRFDLAILACNQLNLPLTVVGNGPGHEALKTLAGPTIEFVTNASDDEMPKLFAGAIGFLFPGVEDFGITPVEAMAAGTPVIAYKAGGALDYVKENKTGAFFNTQTPESLVETIAAFDFSKINKIDLIQEAEKFNQQAFAKNIRQFILRIINKS